MGPRSFSGFRAGALGVGGGGGERGGGQFGFKLSG